MPNEKNFCSFLNALITDEKTAKTDYQALALMLDDEKELLLSDLYGPRKRELAADLISSIIKDIGDEEASHGAKLEKIRKLTCEATVS
jgi:hypothetical protein